MACTGVIRLGAGASTLGLNPGGGADIFCTATKVGGAWPEPLASAAAPGPAEMNGGTVSGAGGAAGGVIVAAKPGGGPLSL